MKNSLYKIILLTLVLVPFNMNAQLYKEMMQDVNVNFYDVVNEATHYFENRSKGKGSGWKNFQRWVVENEHKYYPTGDRKNIDPYFVENAYKAFIANSSSEKSFFNAGWQEIGPNFVEQITGHYSVGLGRSASFYVDPLNDQRLYIGSASGGFWKSTDGGTTWSVSSDFLAANGVNTLAVSPTNPDAVLINSVNTDNGYTHGIYRSVDGGDSWDITNFNPTNLGWGGLGQAKEIYQIKYHPTIPNLIFIGTKEGLFRSSDDLVSWTIPIPLYDITEIEFHPTNSNILYAFAKNSPYNVFVSTDAGLTFTTTPIPGNSASNGALDVSTDCPNCVYFAADTSIWRSINEGASFSLISSEGDNSAGFAVNDLDTSKMLSGYVDGYFSNDGGLTFNQVTWWSLGNTDGAGSGNQNSYNTSTNYIHADLQTAECINGVFYAVTDGFLVKSTDNGVSWTKLSNGTGIRMNYNLGLSQANHARTICGSQDNGTSIHSDNNWVEFTGGDGMEGLIHPLNDDWMISSYQYGSHLVTKDGGLTSAGGSAPNGDGYWIAPVLYDPNDHMTIYHFSDSIHRSTDFASNWTLLGSPLFSGDIKYATIAENNSKIIVVSRDSYIEKSMDGGLTFTNIKGTLPTLSISDVVFDPKDDSTIVVVYSAYQNDGKKVYISFDQGSTWNNITYNLGNMPMRSVIVDHTSASTIYVGTEIGIYKKAMADDTWTLYNPDLPNVAVSEMEIMYGSNTLRASTMGRGLWEFVLDGRVDYPTILTTEITDPPTLTMPLEGMNQYVTSTILYDFNLTSVFVKWSVDTADFLNTISMNNISGNTWVSSAPLPNSINGTNLFFKVYAVGNAGDTTETYKFMYAVKELDLTPCLEVQTGNDDAEENTETGEINLTSSDLELCYDGHDQLIGIRFQNIGVPAGSTIENAYIQFHAKNSHSESVDVNIAVNDTDNSAPWSTTAFDISSRPLTTPIVWSFDASSAWTADVTIAQSPNLKTIVQQVVDRPGWNFDNSLSFVLWNSSGDQDIRNPYSENGGPAPTLCLEFTTTLSVDENFGLSDIQLVPNPASDKIQLLGENINTFDIEFVNNLGQKVHVPELAQSPTKMAFDCSNLSSGIYLIRINTGQFVEVKKLVIE